MRLYEPYPGRHKDLQADVRIYWVGQKVLLGFCNSLWKSPKELFGQPNMSESLRTSFIAFYRCLQKPLKLLCVTDARHSLEGALG